MSQLNKRQLGTSNLLVSEIGLGCMSLKSDHKESEYILHQAIDAGINFFDTADLYDFGENEQLIGAVLKQKRKEIILATKGGNQWYETNDHWNWNPSKKYIKEAVKKSLKRLQTDYIDLYQLHGGTFEDPIDETIEAFEELINEGLIRYYGISSIRPNVIKEYVKKSNIISVMMQYSLLDVRPEAEIIELLQKNNISVIARGPLAKGLLTETFSRKITKDGYLNYSEAELMTTLKNLKEWAHNKGLPLDQVALQYCLGNKTVATAIPGFRTTEQFNNVIAAKQQKTLTNQELNELKKFIQPNDYTSHK